MAFKLCPDCGERVYNLGCTNCNEASYIEEQEMLTELLYPLELPPAVDAVDPHVADTGKPTTRVSGS